MLYRREQLMYKYPSTYQLNLAIRNGLLFKVDNGIYSDTPHYSRLEYISLRYDSSIFTMNSAFYFWNLTDILPARYYLASTRSLLRIDSPDIKQCFIDDNIFSYGRTTLKVGNITLTIYNRERMLIELIKERNNLPHSYYHSLILKYREIIGDLDGQSIDNFLDIYPNGKEIYNIISNDIL